MIGIVILVAIAASALLYQFVFRGDRDTGGLLNPEIVGVYGFISSEKSQFLDNPAVKQHLRNEYGIEINYQKAGSIEMIDMGVSGTDFLWPSSNVALELYGQRNGPPERSETIFNSPIVFYSWSDVANVLVSEGFAELGVDGSYATAVGPLVRVVLERRSWSALGLEDLYGAAVITSTDPAKSDSGNLFSGLVATVLFGGTVDERSLPAVLTQVLRVFTLQGYMEHSTGTLFERYLELGMGSFPIIVGYENQIVEFSLQNADIWPQVKDQMVVMYPVPTVFSEHPLIALTENGERFLEALLDDKLQGIAWEQHGFRTGIENDPSALGVTGIPSRITQVIRMPVPEVMNEIARRLR